MREDLLGLPLGEALRLLEAQGICARVTMTAAPRRAASQQGELRVVSASESGELIAARFLTPLAQERSGGERGQDENG